MRLPGSLLADLDRLVWAPCPGRQALPLGGDQGDQDGPWPAGRQPRAGPREHGAQRGRDRVAGQQATLFESALTTLIGRPFGWLVVAEPTARLDAETAELRTQLNVLRRYDEEHAGSTPTGPSAAWPSWTPSARPACGTSGYWSARPPRMSCA